MTAVDEIDYEASGANSAGSSAVVFWTAFGIAAVVGLGIASVLDEAIYHYETGRYPDGGATLISVAAIPLAALAAAVSRSIGNRRGWRIAASWGLIAAPALVVILYAFF